jgi:tripartite-type tricarboxylate transporter receptor subunit TctC
MLALTKRALLANLVLGGAFALAATAAQAQGFPNKPITMIVPFAAGGPTDLIARIVGDHMSRSMGQQVVIENVAGAGGTTGITRAARAPADGYTIMMGHMGTHGAAPGLYPQLAYNPQTDFTPIGLAAGTPIVIVTKKDFPATTLQEFVAKVKADGDKITQAHAGVGSVSHITGLLFNQASGGKPTSVPYRGTGPALNDLVAGNVDFMADQIVNVAEQIKAGTVKAMAVATAQRNPALPNLATTTEGGLANYQVTAWNAVFAPKGLPADVTAKLTEALTKAVTDPVIKKRLEDLGADVPDAQRASPGALAALVKSENERWVPLLKAANITAN